MVPIVGHCLLMHWCATSAYAITSDLKRKCEEKHYRSRALSGTPKSVVNRAQSAVELSRLCITLRQGGGDLSGWRILHVRREVIFSCRFGFIDTQVIVYVSRMSMSHFVRRITNECDLSRAKHVRCVVAHRFGYVALLDDWTTRVYSPMYGGTNATVSFEVPDGKRCTMCVGLGYVCVFALLLKRRRVHKMVCVWGLI